MILGEKSPENVPQKEMGDVRKLTPYFAVRW